MVSVRLAHTDEARDEYDRLRRRVLWRMPSGLYAVGATDRALKFNLMTLNRITQLSFDPKWVGVNVERDAYTHELIESSGVFGVCFIDREDRAIVRNFTKPVEVDLTARTLNGLPLHIGVTGAPILDQSIASLTPRSATRCRPTTTLSSSVRSPTARTSEGRGQHVGAQYGGHQDELSRADRYCADGRPSHTRPARGALP